jgi:hypothetical protein
VTDKLLRVRARGAIVGSCGFDAKGDTTSSAVTMYRIENGRSRAPGDHSLGRRFALAAVARPELHGAVARPRVYRGLPAGTRRCYRPGGSCFANWPHGVAGTQGSDMLRRSNILTAAGLALCCALAPAAAADPFTDTERKLVDEYTERSLGAHHAQPGPFTDSERTLVESPEVQGMVDRVSSEIRATPAVVEVQAPSGGFDWGRRGHWRGRDAGAVQHRGRSGAPDRRPPSPRGGQRGDPMSQARVDQGRSTSRGRRRRALPPRVLSHSPNR